jgi:hypothetical protein
MLQKRTVSEVNKQFLEKICSELKSTKPGFFFAGVGNIVFVSELIDDLEKTGDKISTGLKISALFYIYLTFMEVISSYLSEIFLELAKKRGDKNFLKDYQRKKAKGEHLTFGKLIEYSEKWGICDKGETNFLHEKNFRDKIAHANCFFDSKRNKIIIFGGKDLTKQEFSDEMQRVRDFLGEMIFILNDNNDNLSASLIKHYQKIGRILFKIMRSSDKLKKFKEMDLAELIANV